MGNLKKMKVNTLLFLILIIIGCSSDGINSDKGKSNISDNTFPELKEFGDRKWIIGDFDGNGTSDDTLFESYVSRLTGKETYKVLNNTHPEENIKLVVNNEPVTRIYSNISGVDTLTVTESTQQSGLAILENLGDLNNDKSDEFGLVIKHEDFSNLNSYHIYTLQNNRFKKFFSFSINEMISFETDELFENGRIIKRIERNKIQYKFYSDSATFEIGQIVIK